MYIYLWNQIYGLFIRRSGLPLTRRRARWSKECILCECCIWLSGLYNTHMWVTTTKVGAVYIHRFIHICIYIYTYIYMCIYIYAFICIYIYIYIYIYSTSIYRDIEIDIDMSIYNLYICIYSYLYIHIYVYVYRLIGGWIDRLIDTPRDWRAPQMSRP